MKVQLFILCLVQSLAFAAPQDFPRSIVEHVGAKESEILHCLLEGNLRQYCKVGWGEPFQRLKKLGINAPEAYGSALLIPEITETPFGHISAKKVMERLHGSLWSKWKVAPTLNFVVDWTDSAQCWGTEVLKSSISVQVQGKQIGVVEPGLKNYEFTLVTPAGETSWIEVTPLDSNQNRVKWTSQEHERAIYTEFDFSIRGGDPQFPFSIVPIPNDCRITLSNVQTVLNRDANDRALDSMESQARSAVESMVTGSLHYASKIQGAEGVKCVIAMQLDSFRRSESIPKSERSIALSPRSQASLKSALNLTSHLTGYSTDFDTVDFLDSHHQDWMKSCTRKDLIGLDQFESVPEDASPEIKPIIEKFLIQKEMLQQILEDAWPLAVLLKIVNEDNRRLRWMIDSTVKYKLKTKEEK